MTNKYKAHDDFCKTKHSLTTGNCHMKIDCEECKEIWNAATEAIVSTLKVLRDSIPSAMDSYPNAISLLSQMEERLNNIVTFQQHIGNHMRLMNMFLRIRGWLRMKFGFCPLCNSDDPAVDDCPICFSVTIPYPPTSGTKSLWYQRWREFMKTLESK